MTASNPRAADALAIWDRITRFSADESPLDFVLIWDHLDRFVAGAWLTLEVTFLALLLGGMLAIPLAFAAQAEQWWLRWPVGLFSYVFRGTPLLVQLYLIYFGLAQFEAVRASWAWEPILSKAWWCALIVFTLNTGAYTTEILRGAIVNTERGHLEAGRACGMAPLMLARRIVLPGALRRALPAYGNEVIFMLHGSVVLSTVTLQDVLGVGRWLNGRYYVAYEGFITAMLFYMVLVFLVTCVLRLWESRWHAHLPNAALRPG
jgi:arginine/ornithine transport system permease protein